MPLSANMVRVPGARLPLVSKAAAGVILLGAATVLMGWIAGVEVLIRILPSMVPMNPLTAVLFIVAGVSLILLSKRQEVSGRHSMREAVGGGLALAVVIMSGLKLTDHLFASGFRLDQTFTVAIGSAVGVHSEMPPNTAFEFLLCGAALLLLDFETRTGFRPAQALTLLVGFIALMALIGYAYHVVLLYRTGSYVPMSLVSAFCFALLSLGLLAARPDKGLMIVVTSRTTGGAMARRLLPMAILVPWLLGMVLLMGEQAGYYPRQFAVSIFGAGSIVIFTALIWWNAKLLHSADLGHVRTEKRLAAQHSSTRVLAESGSFAQAIPKFFQVVCECLGWRVGILWTLEHRAEALRCAEIWRSAGTDLHEFIMANRNSLIKKGEDLVGQAWARSEPVWTEDLSSVPGTQRLSLAQGQGLRAACCFPIWLGQEFFGVMEFFSPRVEPRDPELSEMLAAVATQVGLFVERLRAEGQLRETSANLQRSNTELQQFAYVASHDLFEPLRMVTSYLQLLSHRYRDKLDREGNEFIELAVDGAKRMDALIRDLLAYSRLDARARSFAPVECEQVFHAAVANLKVAIEESGATITRGPLPRVMGDSVQLAQVFQNLIGNAIKFRGPQPPRVEVMAERIDREWRFSVRDNGIGIDPKHFERIFVLFQRLHTRQEYAGTGMGLAICKKIIQRHGGTIWVESAPGAGTTFFFTLPVLDGSPP